MGQRDANLKTEINLKDTRCSVENRPNERPQFKSEFRCYLPTLGLQNMKKQAVKVV